MKALVLLAVTWFGALVPASADLTLTQRVEGGGQSGDQIIRIKGDRARCDIGPAISLITDRKSGESITLAHSQKGFLTISPERAKAMLEQMRKASQVTEPPKLVAAGKQEKVGEYACDVFTTNLGAVKVTYWIAKEFPNYQAVLSELQVIEGGALSATAAGLMPPPEDFPGMKIKTLIEKGDQKVTTTLVSVKEEPVDPAIFEIPK
ncbi:MAG TPA: DUF4412 domain-containing protein, partial [Chthoniobacteraceae bacterium]|nr:DUF4412 domain-containing protein [Chthoniobacteraceae bacterium]